MKKTKVVATIGPSSKEKIILQEMIEHGMDVARINMRYSSIEFCKDIIYKIKDIDRNLKTNTAILIELPGPIISTHNFSGGQAYYKLHDIIRIYNNKIIGDTTKFSIDNPEVIVNVKTNDIIKINKGLVSLKVKQKKDDCILCEVIKEGFIVNESDVRIVDSKFNVPFITSKDKKILKFATEEKVDYVTLTLVNNAEDVLSVNDILIEYNNDHTSIITKIEKESAFLDIDEIVKVSDGVMIDRESLGVEIMPERIPGITRSIINKCHFQAKLSLVITEMESTIVDIVPSKEQINDIATTICDGVDAVVITGETTIGKYPVGTINKMKKIIESSELDINYLDFLNRTMRSEKQDVTGMIAYSVVDTASKLNSIAIVIPTISGYTAKKISRYKPNCPIIALTPNPIVAKSLGLFYGVYPVLISEPKSLDTILKISKNIVTEKINYNDGDTFVITGGYPFKEVKHTNFMRIEEL